ncbi:MAG: hypothetical protein HY653_08335 [Acidobacteria bacterium]|nr:hypothetical protein [Acidobacteriota bacterium]
MRPIIQQTAGWLLFLPVLLTVGCEKRERVQIPLDGEMLEAVYWQPEKELSPAVLLVSGTDSRTQERIPLGDRLQRSGYGVLAIAVGEDKEAEVAAGFSFLREQKRVDAARLGVLGVGLGGPAALKFSAGEPLVQALVLVSLPAAEPEGPLEDAMAYYGWRPVLLAAGEDDLDAPRVARLSRRAQGTTVVKLYEGSAQGLSLLRAIPALEQALVAFFDRHLRPPVLDTPGGGG